VHKVNNQACPEEAAILNAIFENLDACDAVIDALGLSLKVLFGPSYTGFEANINHLDTFAFPTSLIAISP